MASLPPAHPSLALHLTDNSLTPILSSSNSGNPTQSDALTALTTAALNVYASSARLGLGQPQRIMLDLRLRSTPSSSTTHSDATSSGPIVLHSFLSPPSRQLPPLHRDLDSHSAVLEETRGGLRPMSASTDADTEVAESSSQSEDLGGVTPTDGAVVVNGDKGKAKKTEAHHDTAVMEDDEENGPTAPMLVSTVIAPGRERLGEARRAAGGLERVGIRFQREWIRELETSGTAVEGEEG